MKKLLSFVLNITVIISLLIPSNTALGSTTGEEPFPLSGLSSTGLFRTTITIEQAYDLTRLEKLDLTVLAQDGDQIDVLVTELQLESLSRLGFEPTATNELGNLVQASADSSPWLATALEEELYTSSKLAKENLTLDAVTVEANNDELLSIAQSFPDEVINAIEALPGVDNDADGLTDTQELWWCTNPNNPDSDTDGRKDGVEIQVLKDWMANRRSVAPGETPWSSWPFNPVTCPDKDYDSIPNLAERWELGLNMDLESTDRDKFDDGQEVFGVTYCPGGDFSCGYGDLPRSSDAGYVGQVMPSWVKAPGNHPFVAAFPLPDISVEQSSFQIVTVTEITTDHVITSGTERAYSTTNTEGTSTSEADTETWNEWQEVSKTNPISAVSENEESIIIVESAEPPYDENRVKELKTKVYRNKMNANWWSTLNGVPGVNFFTTMAEALFERSALIREEQVRKLEEDAANKCDINAPTLTPKCAKELFTSPTDNDYIENQLSNQDQITSGSGMVLGISDNRLTFTPQYELSFPVQSFTPTETKSSGTEWGGAHTTTHTTYSEVSVTNTEAFSNSESWGNATATNTSYAAELRFEYVVNNSGTEYAKEISDLAFNVYIGDNENPITTYFVATDLGGDGKFHNFMPGEEHVYFSSAIPLTLDQLKAIDLGSPIFVILQDYSYGVDELFYQNAMENSLSIAIEDGVDDGDEEIDHFPITTYEGDMVTDVLSRFFPHIEGFDGNLEALWTPEYKQEIPSVCVEPLITGSGLNKVIWCKHALSTADWWNIYTSDLGDGSLPIEVTPATIGATALFRFNTDSDLDGYSDRTETRLGTDPFNANSLPQTELIGGINSIQSGNNVTSTLSLLNSDLYDAYGVESVMIAPDDSITILKNTVGGAGRVRSGKQVIVGSKIFSPEYYSPIWTGTAKPVSSGYFTGTTDLLYTFTVSCSLPAGCIVGQDNWSLNWSDGSNSGSLPFNDTYQSPNTISVGLHGVQLSFISGKVINGNTFYVEAHTPRDTFQYTINYEPHTEPIVIVSYNNPQGNHRFVIPPEAMNLSIPSDNLAAYSSTMQELNGVEIVTTTGLVPGNNSTQFVLDNPSAKTLINGHIFLGFFDSEGNVVAEVPYTGNFTPGPNVIDINWDTGFFSPVYNPDRDYLILAFWTDYEGNIIDVSGRPLSSFQVDPQPEFAFTADEAWNFGSTQQGTVLKRTFSFANTGDRTLLTYIDAPEGIVASQTGSKNIGPGDIMDYEVLINAEELPLGVYDEQLTIHTSDTNNPTKTIAISGTITASSGDHPVSNLIRPLDYAVTVPGPQTKGTWYSFTHPIDSNPQTLHPVRVYSQDYSTLHGWGKYAIKFGVGTGGFNLFGDGSDGDFLVATGVTKQIPNTKTNITASATTGTVTSSTGFAVGDLVLLHQTQGTNNVGKWEYAYIASGPPSTTITFTKPLTNSYSSSTGKAQMILVPQYHDVTVQTGGTLNTPAWNGSTGGIMVFVANGTVNIAGTVTANGSGYRLGDRGERTDPVKADGWQGESYIAGSTQSRNNYNGGGGGGMGDDDSGCGESTCEGAGGGGGGYGSIGSKGVDTSSTYLGGLGGTTYGTGTLTQTAFLGSGGGGGGADGDNNARVGGYGGAGGGSIYLSGQQVKISGTITSKGNNGLSGAGGDGVRTGGGGGGSGGSILITGSDISLGSNLIASLGGTGGPGVNSGGNGGNGGVGRIFAQYCNSISGSTNPAAVTSQISCHIAEQVEAEPFTTTRLAVPETITAAKTYAVQYGRRLIFSEAGDQTSVIPMPARLLNSANLDLLISEVGVGPLALAMDVGNDGLTDYVWSGDVTNLKSLENIEVKETLNRWWLNSSKQLSGEVSVPVRISLSKPGQVLITDLKVTSAASSLESIRLEGGSYVSVLLDYKATETNGPLSIALDVGDNGTIDDTRRIESPFNPQRITSANLAASFNAFLSGKTGSVDVPVRFYFTGCTDVKITNYHATKTGTLDISISASDIVLPGYEPIETSIVPVSATIHNNGNLPTGYFTASFYASTAEFGDWYIGSALYPPLSPGQAATREIQWNTSGFTGTTIVKVIADPYERMVEAVEDNNLALKTIYIRTRPDVATSGISFSNGEPVLNEQIEVTLDVTNLGETDAGQMTTSLYDGDPENGGELIGDQITAIAATNDALLTLPWQPVRTGWHRLYVQTDKNQQVDEFDEANNTYWQDVYVGLAGPLLIDSGATSDQEYSAENGFGYVDTNLPDVTTTCGSGTLPEETIRLDPEGRILYQFDQLLPGHFYHLDITMYECDGAGRLQYIMVDENQFTEPIDLGDGSIHKLSLRLDPAFYADRSITVAIATNGIDGAIVSEVNLHDVDYRYADAGGSMDPQYPGSQGFGWLEGTASTNYGVLPYQSLRIDLSNNDMRYRFDDLDPDKKYNVLFTFWQPQDKGRIMDILVDGAYSGLTVDTSDYLKHQEVISIPFDAYQTDGSIVVSMLRTNAISGAMVNEIALEEETISAVYSPNKAPIANAGPDQSVNTNASVTLDGSGSSDPDGNTPLTYAWAQTAGISVTLSDNTVAKPTFTAPGDPSTLMFSLIVTDSLGKSSVADKVKITVNNQVPIANAGPDQTVNILSTVTLDGSGSSDPDGDIPFVYNWSQTTGASVTLNNQTTVNPTFTAPVDPGFLKFSLVVTDSFGLASAPDEVIITTTNQGPVISDIPDQEILQGGNFTPISLDEYVSDVDDPDSAITWSYSGNTNLNVSIINRVAIITAKTMTWTGSETITFKATDPGGLYDEDTVTFTILPPNEVPILSSTSPTFVYVYEEELPVTLHVYGDNFIDGSLILWNGVDRTDTVFVSETELSIDLTEYDLSIPGVVDISVFTPAPGGGVSATIELVIVGISPTFEEKLTSSKVMFDWDGIPEATAYKIKVSTKPDFSVLLLNIKTTTSEYSYDTFLNYNKTYYWKIRPIFGDIKGSWSPVFRFTSMDPLAAPALVSPPHKDSIKSPVTLEWTPVVNAVQYKVVVATDPAFTVKVKKPTVSATTATFELPAGKYFWRVRALDEFGAKGPWSEVRILKVIPE